MSQAIQTARSGSRRWLALIAWLVLVAAVSGLGGWLTLPQIPTWYAGLVKPGFTPPNAVFGPVWTTLYIMMAVAAWRIGEAADNRKAQALTLFGVQLALNAVWSPVFFGLHAPRPALAIIVALDVALALTLLRFWRIDRAAGLLLVPYLAWVCYATALNAAIVAMN